MARRSFAYAREPAATAGQPQGVPARQQLLKRHNLALVLGHLAGAPNLSRAQLAAGTGLTKATVSTLVYALMDAGLIVEHDPERGLIGRPGSPLALNAEGPAGLGVEINVDYVSACVVDLTGTVRLRNKIVRDNRLVAPVAVLENAARAAARLIDEAEAGGLYVCGLGVGVPGLVLALIAKLLLRDLSDFVFVSGEIGVGAGIVIGGQLFRGVRGLGGELGHVTVDPNGPRCSCGSRGCLESIAGREALLESAGLAPRRTDTGTPGGTEELLERAIAGERTTLDALDRAARALGIALAAFLNVLDLPSVVLGGFYAELAPWLIGPVTDELSVRVVNSSWASTEVVASSLGTEASVKGAAGITTRRIIDDPAGLFPEVLTKT